MTSFNIFALIFPYLIQYSNTLSFLVFVLITLFLIWHIKNNILYPKLIFILCLVNNIPKIILLYILIRIIIVLFTKHDIELDYSCYVCHAYPEVNNPQDVDPIHNSNLNVLYNKLSRLLDIQSNLDPNRGLTMNSNNLRNGLVFDDRDHATMEKQIKDAYPNYMHRFNPNHSRGFSFSGNITTEIHALFKPT